jgi:hypothetical protein
VAADAGDFIASDPYPFAIGDTQGLAADIRGILFDRPFTGRVVVAVLSGERVFHLMAVGLQDGGVDYWAIQGEAIFNAVVGSIRFFEPTDSACPVAPDHDYGYSPQFPVRVGGDALEGPFRERLYLDNLRGPNFEPVTYERLGSEPYGETILDLYRLTYPGQDEPALLYLDEYTFETLQAPAGFKCPQPFDLPFP